MQSIDIQRTVQSTSLNMKSVILNTFNNISAISWRSDILMEETEVPGENHYLQQLLTNFIK